MRRMGTARRDGQPGRRRTGRRSGAATAGLALALPLLLAACGGGDEAPTPAPATEPPAATTEAGTPAADGIGPGGGTPAASPAAGAVTLGDLVARVDAAWAGAGSYRAVFSPLAAGATPAATPLATPATGATGIESLREVVLPDRQRQEVRRGGEVTSEAIAVADRAWVRGELARAFRPDAPADAWVEVDPAAVDVESDAGRFVAALVAPTASPLAGIPERLRPQEVRPLGPVDVGDRTCEAYGAADTTEIGGRIDYTIALGPDDLPCFIETRSGTGGGRTTYEAYGEPLTIEPPATALPAATPIPGATPATPAGRD